MGPAHTETVAFSGILPVIPVGESSVQSVQLLTVAGNKYLQRNSTYKEKSLTGCPVLTKICTEGGLGIRFTDPRHPIGSPVSNE